MSLRFIYGRAGSGKSYFCLNDIKSRLDDGLTKPLILLVPEQYSLQAEKNLIKISGTGGIIKTEVLSFRRMAYRVFNEVGCINCPHLNSAGKCMIIYKILESMRDSFKIFSKSSNQQGFVKTLSDMITEFKTYNITPEDLVQIQDVIGEDGLLKEKLSEITSIYAEFEKAINERYRDSEDDLTLLAEKIDKSSQFDHAEIWIDEFSGFTPQQYSILGKLLKKADRINICLCTDCLSDVSGIDSIDVFSPVKNTAAKLSKIAEDMNVTIEKPVVLSSEQLFRFKSCDEIAHLERQYFAFPYRTYPLKTKDIIIFSSINIYSEIENTARDIIKLCRDRGMRFRNIAVVSRNLDMYEKLIAAVFNEYGIPYFIDKKIDITNHPLIRLILSVFEIFTKNWSYESVFRYLKTGLTGISQDDIDLIENYVLSCGIKGSRWTQEESWNFKQDSGFDVKNDSEDESNLLTRINDIRSKIVKPLTAFRSKTKGRKNAREVCEALFEFLSEISIPERIENYVEDFRKSGELALSNEYGQVWNITMEVFDQIVEVLGDDTIGIERFSNILKVGLNEYKIGLIPPSVDQVLVGSIERSRSHEVQAVYILGVNDGIFPSSSEEEGILSDRDRNQLRSAGFEIAKDTRTKAFEEQFLMYTIFTTAASYLRFSYPIADSDGRTMRPSIIISRLRKIFPEIVEYSNITTPDTDDANIELVTGIAPTFNELVSVIRKQNEGTDVNPLWWDVYNWYTSKKEWQEKCRTALSALTFSNQVKPIETGKVGKLYGSPFYSSVSRFEQYVNCPFSYYVQYGLKARERKIFKLSPPDVGTFMHAVIDRFSQIISEKNMSWRELDREWCSKTVSDIVDELLDKMQGSVMNSSSRYRKLSGRLKRVLTRSVLLIAEHIKRSSFEPVGHEVEFGDHAEFPAITIELPSGDKINLTGRIDRVDALKTENGTFLRIIDYKSGNKVFKLSDVYYGMQIQLITYLDAIWKNGGKNFEKPVMPGGMLYFKIDDPIIRGNSRISEEDIEKSIMRQLKMKGLLLADVQLIKEMDSQIDGDSMIIPARINKGDVLGRSSAATMEQFEALRKYVKKLLVNIGEEMLKGNVSINPYKKKRITSCKFCSYSSVCQFDSALKDNKYRTFSERSDEEIWGMMDINSGSKGDNT